MTEQLLNSFVDLFKDKIPPELTMFIVSMLPIFELRGGLIAAKMLDVEPIRAFIICYLGNMLPVPFILLLIKKIFIFLRRYKPFEKLITKFEGKAEKNREKIMRGKQWGLLIFVAIPLPGTGAWTGALMASLLDIRFKKSLPIIALGVLIAGIIMALIVYGIFGAIFA